MSIYAGTKIRVEVSFLGLDGALADPGDAVLSVIDPDKIETQPDLVSDGEGLYHYDLTFSKDGSWSLQGVGSGAFDVCTEILYVTISAALL